MSQSTKFHKVWFLPEKNPKRRWKILSYEDIGILTVEENHIEFIGRRHHLSINSINQIEFGIQGWDLINNWVHIDTGGKTLFFADGGWLGYRGHLAHGTRKILRAVLAAFPTTKAEAAAPNGL